jgi:hypothetical protein
VQHQWVTVNGSLLRCNADEPISPFEPSLRFRHHPPGDYVIKPEPQSILKTDESSIVVELGH